MSVAIEVDRIVKTFGGPTAVDGVSFTVAPGEVFGVLGPSGAGKSTLFRMLVTLLPPTAGSASIDGLDVVARAGDVRRAIGVVLQALASDPELTVAEHVLVFARLHGLPRASRAPRIAELLQAVELTPWAGTPVKALSAAVRRRVEIARALVHGPKVLFLDEPTAGLDPASRSAMWTMLQKLKAERGLTILLTTPDPEEARALCDRVARLEHGRIVSPDVESSLSLEP